MDFGLSGTSWNEKYMERVFFQLRPKGMFWETLGRVITRSDDFPPSHIEDLL